MRTRETLANNLRYLRLEKGLSQAALAEASGLTVRSVGGIERGEQNLSLDSVDDLARALDVSPVLLLVSERASTDAKTEALRLLNKCEEKIQILSGELAVLRKKIAAIDA